MKNINLDEKFWEYFHEQEGFGLRSERFYDSLEAFSNQAALAASMKLWLQAAFVQGARVMAQDTVDTLRDYGTALSGIECQGVTPTQAYDDAADNLMTYYTQILKDSE